MKIVDKTVGITRRTSLSAIPVGTIFRGSIIGANSGVPTRGLFFKAYGKWKPEESYTRAAIVVRLDKCFPDAIGYANLWANETDVFDYEPLDVTLTINGTL